MFVLSGEAGPQQARRDWRAGWAACLIQTPLRTPGMRKVASTIITAILLQHSLADSRRAHLLQSQKQSQSEKQEEICFPFFPFLYPYSPSGSGVQKRCLAHILES